jgi:hypothetical protein
MDKRKLRLILLGIAGIIILVIGIGAVNIYTQTASKEARDSASEYLYGRDYDELSDAQRATIDVLISSPSMHEKNAQFREWLVKPLKWIGIGFGTFLILTAALVVSRVISNRLRPPSGSN